MTAGQIAALEALHDFAPASLLAKSHTGASLAHDAAYGGQGETLCLGKKLWQI